MGWREEGGVISERGVPPELEARRFWLGVRGYRARCCVMFHGWLGAGG